MNMKRVANKRVFVSTTQHDMTSAVFLSNINVFFDHIWSHFDLTHPLKIGMAKSTSFVL